MNLKDKKVVVTGGSRGLGLGLVEALVAHGAKVTVVARDADGLGSVRARLGAAGGPVVGSGEVDVAAAALAALASRGWIGDGAVCIVELAINDGITLPTGFTLLDDRRYGKARLLVVKYQSTER